MDDNRIKWDIRVLTGLTAKEKNLIQNIDKIGPLISFKKLKQVEKRKASRIRKSKIKTLISQSKPIICFYCNKILSKEEVTADHYIPMSKGGKTTHENIVLACDCCNHKKADKIPADNYIIYAKQGSQRNNI